MCTHQRFGSHCAFAQSDQNPHWAHFGYPRVQSFFMRTTMTLIRLRGCAGWSESSLGAHARRYVFSCCDSYGKMTSFSYIETLHCWHYISHSLKELTVNDKGDKYFRVGVISLGCIGKICRIRYDYRCAAVNLWKMDLRFVKKRWKLFQIDTNWPLLHSFYLKFFIKTFSSLKMACMHMTSLP